MVMNNEEEEKKELKHVFYFSILEVLVSERNYL